MSILVSCISTRHSVLKRHWQAMDQHTRLPRKVRGSVKKPEVDLGGCLAIVAEDGQVLAQDTLDQPSGLFSWRDEILVACRTTIHSYDHSLALHRRDRLASQYFNALHTVRSSRRGILIVSTGLDLLLELDEQGKVLWRWWAHDHGLDCTPLGRQRALDRSMDYRDTVFGTLQQATHVNSAIEAPNGEILATLFHQNMVIGIDRFSGEWRPIITDLPHLHSVRTLDDRHFSVVDTERGRVLIVEYTSGQVVASVSVVTRWLQDALYDANQKRWLLVDGEKSRILIRKGNDGSGAETVLQLNPEWRLYEVLPMSDGL